MELIPDPEFGGFTARLPDIPAYGEGKTEDEAIADLKDALAAYVEVFGLEEATSRLNPKISSVPKLPRPSGAEMARFLKTQGFAVVRIQVSHYILARQELRTTVPVHGSEILKIGTLRGILRDRDFTASDFTHVLRCLSRQTPAPTTRTDSPPQPQSPTPGPPCKLRKRRQVTNSL